MFRVLLSPRMIGLHLLAVVATVAAAWLGAWQYGAWQAHREDQAQDRADATPRALDRVMSADDPFPASAVGRPVEVSGEWLPHESFYVTGKTLHGDRGYWAVTPIAVCDDGCAGDAASRPAMLVVRGWTPSPDAAPEPPSGPADTVGWLQPAEGSGPFDQSPGDDVLPALSIATVIQRFDQDLYGGYVMARAHEPGLSPLTPAALPAPDAFTAVRNLFYAAEWWLFGGFAVFLWWRWCVDELRPRPPAGEDDPGQELPQHDQAEHDRNEGSDAEVASTT